MPSAGDVGCVFHPVLLSGSPLFRRLGTSGCQQPCPSLMAWKRFSRSDGCDCDIANANANAQCQAERSSMLVDAGRISCWADKSYLIVSDILGEPLRFAAWNPGIRPILLFSSARHWRQTTRQLAGSHFLLRCPVPGCGSDALIEDKAKGTKPHHRLGRDVPSRILSARRDFPDCVACPTRIGACQHHHPRDGRDHMGSKPVGSTQRVHAWVWRGGP
jgi:hypothetical protein